MSLTHEELKTLNELEAPRDYDVFYRKERFMDNRYVTPEKRAILNKLFWGNEYPIATPEYYAELIKFLKEGYGKNILKGTYVKPKDVQRSESEVFEPESYVSESESDVSEPESDVSDLINDPDYVLNEADSSESECEIRKFTLLMKEISNRKRKRTRSD
jgi:hypothetical protein